MPLSFLDRLRLKFHPFNSQDAENPELRGLTRKKARDLVEQKRAEFLQAYIEGKISGYQCRIFLNDYIRDSIPLEDEVEFIKRHQQSIEVATIERKVPPEDDEIEHSLCALAKYVRSGELTLSVAQTRLERMIRGLPDPKQCEWRDAFRYVTEGETKPPSSTQNTIVGILRWVAVVPASIAAALVARFAFVLVHNITAAPYIAPDSWLNRVFVEYMGGVVLGATGVYTAAYVAPTHRKAVVGVTAAVTLLLAGWLLFPAIVLQEYWSVMSLLCIALGAGVVAYATITDQIESLR